ncbi:MAG: SusC/RagA family TonB-linked outer membrane protein [Saprospiraceae bacterium]|nr:SusC/RagA family TonB-linked outer membrane protein [Saprospiraceae bacterium]
MRLFLISILLLLTGSVYAQTTVTGTVTDETGEALIGATVRGVGSNAAALTDINGEFSISIPDNVTELAVTYIGYAPMNIALDGSSSYSVQMQVANEIQEVVVQAYGKDGQTPLTGSIALVEAEKIEGVPIASFEQILQGSAPGLSVVSGSGQPGTAATVRIRGVASISGNNAPLYILDGIQIEPSEFASLNPNDFEVAAILKDAASTSIYGSRASNGVILLKTKTGQAGKTRIKYVGQTGFSNPARQKFEQMSSEELLAFQEIAGRGAGWILSPNNPSNAGLSVEQQQANADELARLRGTNNDLRDVFFREGRTNSHDLSFSGGNENSRFFLSLGYYDEEGIGVRSGLERKSARLNIDNNVTDKMRISIKGYAGGSESSFIESENGIALANAYAAVYLANPFETILDENGQIPYQGNDPNGINQFAGYTGSNAFARLNQDTSGRDEFKGTGSFSLEYDILENLTVKGFAGIDYRTRFTERFQDPDGYAGDLVGNGQDGLITETTTRLRTYTLTPTLNYFKDIGEDHFINALVGYEFLDRDYLNNSFTGFGINNLFPGITPGSITFTNDAGESVANVGGRKTRNQLSSGFANVSYTFKNKYELGGGIRRDASSRFGPNNKEATFWSSSLKWSLDQEDFLVGSNVVDLLRLRASYGTTGNQELAANPTTDGINFPYVSTLAAGTNGPNSTLIIGTPANPDLQWESAEKANIGVDFGLWGKFNGSLDVYNDITDDLFIQKAIPGSTGTGSYTITPFNAGSVRNRGIELEMDYDIINKGDWYFAVGADVAYNENEILDLGGESEFPTGTSIVRVGEELGAHYIVGWAGVDPATGDPLYHDGTGGITKDFNLATPTTGWGSFNAPYVGGFNTTVGWKGFDIYAQFNYAADYRRFNNQTFFQENPNFAQFNLSRVMNTIWREPGDVTEIQRIGTNRQFSSKDIEDADFLRFRNLRASYSLPDSFINKMKIDNASIFMNGTNLYTWTRFGGFDPEDSNNIAGYEYPLPRQLTFGLNLGL